LFSPIRREALEISKIEPKRKGGLVKYKCAECNKKFAKSEVTVDHMEPVIDPKQGFPQLSKVRHSEVGCHGKGTCSVVYDLIDDWTVYINRLFCPVKLLQILCKPCHNKKTQEERKCRKKS